MGAAPAADRRALARPGRAWGPRDRGAFLGLVLAQALHSVEEYVGRLWEVFAPARWVTSLLGPDHETAFLLYNGAWVAFGLWCWWWPVRRGWRIAPALAWLWVAVEVVNGIGHPLWSLRVGAYTPGVATAPLLLGLASWLAWRLSGRARGGPATAG